MASRMSPESPLSRLIAHLYDAAMDPALWPGTADRIAQALGSTSAVLKLHADDGQVALLECTDNLIVSARDQAWADDWHRRDLWVERSVQYGMGRVITDDDLVSPQEQRSSGFYQEWLRHLDIHHLLGAVFPAGAGSVAVLGIHRPAAAGRYRRRERDQAVILLPHLQRALRLRQQLQDAKLQRGLALEALERLDAGVFIVDVERRVRYMNSTAERLLREETGLSVLHDRLSLQRPAWRDRLSGMLQAVLQEGCAEVVPTVLQMPRHRRLPLVLEVAPLGPGHAAMAGGQRAALVLVRDPEISIPIDRLQALFGLTRTEVAVASALVRGQSLPDMAAQMQVGLETLRTHIKHILLKTGTHRQAEAAALLAGCMRSGVRR